MVGSTVWLLYAWPAAGGFWRVDLLHGGALLLLVPLYITILRCQTQGKDITLKKLWLKRFVLRFDPGLLTMPQWAQLRSRAPILFKLILPTTYPYLPIFAHRSVTQPPPSHSPAVVLVFLLSSFSSRFSPSCLSPCTCIRHREKGVARYLYIINLL